MFCRKCGAQLDDGARFCRMCGAQVVYEVPGDPVETPCDTDDVDEGDGETSKLGRWWKERSGITRFFVVAAAVAAGVAVWKLLGPVLEDIWMTIFIVALVVGVGVALFSGSKEERTEVKGMIVKFALMIVVAGAIAFVVVLKPDFITDIVKPGAGVREGYLEQYSEEVTVEEAFDNFFDKGKWGTFKDDGYSFVEFRGMCEVLGERADARIVFKITGEKFTVDRLDINGVEQSDLVLYALLARVYEDY